MNRRSFMFTFLPCSQIVNNGLEREQIDCTKLNTYVRDIETFKHAPLEPRAKMWNILARQHALFYCSLEKLYPLVKDTHPNVVSLTLRRQLSETDRVVKQLVKTFKQLKELC